MNSEELRKAEYAADMAVKAKEVMEENYLLWMRKAKETEEQLQSAEAKIVMLRKLGNDIIENLGGQNHTNGGDDFYQVDHAVIAPFGEALDECAESSAKFLAGVKADDREYVSDYIRQNLQLYAGEDIADHILQLSRVVRGGGK
jgi:hypothetical protein